MVRVPALQPRCPLALPLGGFSVLFPSLPIAQSLLIALESWVPDPRTALTWLAHRLACRQMEISGGDQVGS